MSTQGRSRLATAVRTHLDTGWTDWDIDDALARGILDAVRSALGTVVTARQINDAFPALPAMDDFGTVDLDDSDDVVDKLDPYLCAAEGLPLSFWQDCGLEFHESVFTICIVHRGRSVDLGVVTDGETDWWFNFVNTNVAGNGYGPPAPATNAHRRAEIEELVVHGDGFLRSVDRVETSLRGADLEWLTRVAKSHDARVVSTRGSMTQL